MRLNTICSLSVALLICAASLCAQDMRISHDPGGSIADTKDKPLTYGLKITAPWRDGGHIILNLPEHLTHGANQQGILRWADNRREDVEGNPWKLSADGHEATLDVESPYRKGIRVIGKVQVAGDDRLVLSMKIVNNTARKLTHLRGLYCTHYRLLTGFPSWGKGLPHTWVLMDGAWRRLSEVPVKNPKTSVRWGRVKGRTAEPNAFVTSRGAAIQGELDAAVAVVTATDGKRKLAISWKPGNTMLSNAGIPCLHADPYYADIPPGESREAEGIMIFTENSLDNVRRALQKAGFIPVEKP